MQSWTVRGGSVATWDEPPGHTLSAHSTDSYSVQMERNGSWDVPEKQMKGLQMKLNAPCKRFL